MAELNLKQIIDRLNEAFVGDTRKLVFWYDDKADFVEDIDTLELENAKILKLELHNQLETKRFLERQDTTTNYLIYAPFAKPDVRENHLEDTVMYSKRFYADRASLLCVDLGINPQWKYVMEKHIKFFANKERTARFYDLGIETFHEDTILIGLMSAVCRIPTCSFDAVVSTVLKDNCWENNKFLAEFDKYDLIPDFWKFCEQQFGYTDSKPTLKKLSITLFVTYADRYIQQKLPKSWGDFVSCKSGNIIAFMDNLRNHYSYRGSYDLMSDRVAEELKIDSVLQDFSPDTLLECDTFSRIDRVILEWITARLLEEDTGAKLGEYTIPEICEMRSKMHFAMDFETAYVLLDSAYHLIYATNYFCPNGFKSIVKQYTETDCMIDNNYRRFYFCYDEMENTDAFEQLRDLIENIYTNEYLCKQLPKWNEGLLETDALSIMPLQRDFFKHFVKNNKERTVVIISDAMRYEVGRELFAKMQDDPKCTAKLEPMLNPMPSYTRLGMAALLPHQTLELTDDGKELVDDVYCTDLASRQAVLQKAVPESCCVQFDDVKNMKKAALREVFTGKQVVYIYHDQIDVRGEHTEDEVFIACEEAVTEIADLIRRICLNANTLHFIVTADHGFIYKRDKVTESDKIGGVSDKNSIVKRRYIVSNQPVQEDGVCNFNLGYLLGNDDTKIVSFPCSTNVFKTPGNGGLHYVHGGSSPQEMIVPVLNIKMEKGHMETRPAQIMLVSLVQKITNLITTLDFIQSEAVNDVVRATTYRLYFVSEKNERISNQNIYMADKRDTDVQKRIFRMRFTFKNQKYDNKKPYYLVAYDENNDMEVFRHPIVMDVAFADDFGFGF